MKNDLLKMADLSKEDIIDILNLASQLKYERKNGIEHKLLAGKSLGMIFQKASTRTRVSFETGMYQLGGQALFLPPATFRSDAASRCRTPRACFPVTSTAS